MNVNSIYTSVYDFLDSAPTVDQCACVEDCVQALNDAYAFQRGGNHRERSSMLQDYITALTVKKYRLEGFR